MPIFPSHTPSLAIIVVLMILFVPPHNDYSIVKHLEIQRNLNRTDLSGIQFYVKPTYLDGTECVPVRNGNAKLDVTHWRWTNCCASLQVARYVLASISHRHNELASCQSWMLKQSSCVDLGIGKSPVSIRCSNKVPYLFTLLTGILKRRNNGSSILMTRIQNFL